jgi:hypothetical protein
MAVSEEEIAFYCDNFEYVTAGRINGLFCGMLLAIN